MRRIRSTHTPRLYTILFSLRRKLFHLRSLLVSFFSKVPHRMAPRDETRRGHAGIIVDLFAAIMARVKGASIDDDLDTVMNILRYDFPNVEHVWLAERFMTAFEARYPLEATLALAAAKRTEAERCALAMEILTLLHRVGGDLTNPELFARVTLGLNLPWASTSLEHLFSTPGATSKYPIIETISFSGCIGRGNVTLAVEDAGVRFRALRCVNLLLIINDGDVPISLRGQTLNKGDVLPISAGQAVKLSRVSINYNAIRAFLQSHYSGIRYVYYVYCEDDTVTISRQRQRNCIARIHFGLHVELQLLSNDADFVLDGVTLHEGAFVNTSYYTPFTVQGIGPFSFGDLQPEDEAGRSFQLAPGNRKVIVSNLPYMNNPGVLMLTPGLAPGTIFEVNYSRNSNTGELRVLEGSTHSLTVQGEPVRGDTPLKDGDLIGLSAVQYLRCRFSAGVLDEESSVISSLNVQSLTRDFGRAGRVLDNIDFSLKRGEMACVLGPSGSGKSTLLSMLAGHLAPTFGEICYNDEKMSPAASELRRHVAYIPREDILDEAMTVGEHVYQASIARRPRLNHSDRMRRVLAILNFVGISHLTKRNVGRAGERTISDGERTRLNLGLDLTGTAEVFLIDEPISGLSSGDADKVIQTLENMASGRIVLCTLHRPAQSILNRFKKVMVLTSKGQMAFWGTPQEMALYFRKAAYDMGLMIPPEAIAAGGADYVFEVLEASYNSLKTSEQTVSELWQARFERAMHRTPKEKELVNNKARKIPRIPRRTPLELWKLFCLWSSRTYLARIRSRMGLYAVLLEGPVLALLIAGTLRAASETPYTYYKALHINEYLFLSLVLAMFFGLTDSACEILRDRALIKRESNYKLFIPGYLVAKTLVLTAIAGTQCALYLLVGNLILEINDMFWPHLGIMVLTAFVGISLSLMVSAFVRSDRTALNIVPLLLVPQILLAGALVRFEEMNEYSPTVPEYLIPDKVENALSNLRHRVAYQDETTHNILTKPVPLLAEFCPLRYAFEMMFVLQTSFNPWEIESARVNEHRDYVKEHGSSDEIRFVQRAALLLNTTAPDSHEARTLLHRVRKAATMHDEQYLRNLEDDLESSPEELNDQPLEFFFSNRKLTALREGVKTARKDGRLTEHRGFFLSPRQAPPFGGLDQETDAGSIPTLGRNAIYLAIMGLIPILLAGWRLRKICRG